MMLYQYNISFNEEDAEKNGNNFIFDKNNNKFQLTPLTPSPIPPTNGEIKTVCKWNGSIKSDCWLFTEISPAVGKSKLKFEIAKNHPFFNQKKLDRSSPPFNIKFLEKNASSKEDNNHWYFEASNSSFELTPVGNWPDDPNWTPPNPSPPINSEVKVRFNSHPAGYNGYIIFVPPGPVLASQYKIYKVTINHPEIKRLKNEGKLKGGQDEFFTLKYEYINGIDGAENYSFDASNSLKIINDNFN